MTHPTGLIVEIPKNYFDVALFMVAAQPWLCSYLTRLLGEEAAPIVSGFIGTAWMAGAMYMMITGAKP